MQGVRLSQRHGDEFVIRIVALVHDNVVLVLAPALLVLRNVFLRHVDAEVSRQRLKYVGLQREDAVAVHTDAVQLRTAVEGTRADALHSARQGNGLQIRAAVEGIAAQMLHTIELRELAEVLQLRITCEDAVDARGFTDVGREEQTAISDAEQYVLIVEQSTDVLAILVQTDIVHVVFQLALGCIDCFDGSIP